jgi:hypothetical protein
MPACRPCLIVAAGSRTGETIMTGGSALYLLMCLITFGAFLWVLARVSAQQDRAEAKASSQPTSESANAT